MLVELPKSRFCMFFAGRDGTKKWGLPCLQKKKVLYKNGVTVSVKLQVR
jgi:hypothetical protein